MAGQFKIGDWVIVDGELGEILDTAFNACRVKIGGRLRWYFEEDISKPTQH